MEFVTIRYVENYSGIKAHTLRIWEQRYSGPKPERKKGNIRAYSLTDFSALLNIALLNRNGFKISRLFSLTSEAISSLLRQQTSATAHKQIVQNELIVQMLSLNSVVFEAVLDKCFTSFSTEEVMNDVIFPFLKKTELLWQGNKLTEEHLVVTTIRKKIIRGIETTVTPCKKKHTVLLFLPDTRQLDLGLLYMNYYLKLNGIDIVYMGNDVSLANLKAVFEIIKPDFVYTYLFRKSKFDIKGLLSQMNIMLPKSTLIVTTPNTGAFPFPAPNVLQMSFDEARSFMVQNLQSSYNRTA